MKHLLIILISILLLSSPVIGDNHKGETLYLWKTSSGVQWKGFGDKQTNPIYEGQVENGKPNGQGTLNLSNGEKYVGEWKNGRPLVKELEHYLMEESMLGNTRMGKEMVKEHSLSLMEALSLMGKNMKGSGRMETLGTEYYTTKRETSYTRL